jgi:hypothetical protein
LGLRIYEAAVLVTVKGWLVFFESPGNSIIPAYGMPLAFQELERPTE